MRSSRTLRLLGDPEALPQSGLEGFHLTLVRLVIVAEQVQISVQQQAIDLARARLAAAPRLPRRVGNRDHDVPQESFRDGFGGKSEDIGRPVLPAPSPVEPGHEPIPAEEDRDLTGAIARGAAGAAEEPPDPRARRRSRSTRPDLDVHSPACPPPRPEKHGAYAGRGPVGRAPAAAVADAGAVSDFRRVRSGLKSKPG